MSQTGSPRIGIVTDSTGQFLPTEIARLQEITGGLFRIVPLSVTIGEDTVPDGTLDPAELCARLEAGETASTSMPAAEDFAGAFAELVAAGAEALVVVVISAGISGTRDAAVQAAADLDIPVDVVDSRTTAAGLAGAVQVVAAGVETGAPPASLAGTVADWCAEETAVYFCPENLEHLRRGGRIGAAAGLVGRALSIVPILTLHLGEVVPVARVRTWSKALHKLLALTVDRAEQLAARHPGHRILVDIQHSSGEVTTETAELAEVLGRRAEEMEIDVDIRFRPLSTVITAHVGPGTIGITLCTAALHT